MLREHGVTLAALERAGAVTAMSVSRWRRGAIGRPQRAAVVRLARALGLPVGVVTEAVVSTILSARRARAVMPGSFYDATAVA